MDIVVLERKMVKYKFVYIDKINKKLKELKRTNNFFRILLKGIRRDKKFDSAGLTIYKYTISQYKRRVKENSLIIEYCKIMLHYYQTRLHKMKLQYKQLLFNQQSNKLEYKNNMIYPEDLI